MNSHHIFSQQLVQLYSNIRTKSLTRTIILGKNKELVQKLLLVISYFIRCSEAFVIDQEVPENFSNFEVNTKSDIPKTEVSPERTTGNGNTHRLQMIPVTFTDTKRASTLPTEQLAAEYGFQKHFSLPRSLMASICSKHCSDFALMGAYDLDFDSLLDDMQHWIEYPLLRDNPEGKLKQACCLVVDTDVG